MYQSAEEICTAALLSLGREGISSFNDLNDRARACKGIYPQVLDEELSRPWRCILSRATLSRLVAAPAFGYAYQYALPADCLKVRQMEDPDSEFQVEGGVLLTDEETAKIIYHRRVENVALLSPGLVGVLVARMALELAMPITSDRNVLAAASSRYERRLMEGLASDGQQGTPEVLEDRTLADARFS